MRRFIRKTLADLRNCTSGNAVLMTALGLPALIGATGFGVDTAQWYMWQRELQHSVDQGALGGAWALAYDKTDYEARARQEYEANQNLTASFDTVPTIRRINFAGGTNNAVMVSASVTRMLPFTGLLLSQSTTVSATATARFEEGGVYTACLLTLKDTGTTFTVGGSAHVVANCGLAALSCSQNSIIIDGSAIVETASIATCGTAQVPPANQSAVSQNIPNGRLTDSYKDIPIPQPDASTPDRTKNNGDYCVGNGNKAIANLAPGIYTGGIVAKCNTNFSSGVYFIDGGVLDLATNATVVGRNVLFVLRDRAQIKLGGSGGTGSVSLSPMDEDQLATTPYAADAARLAGMLFMEEKEEDDTPVDHQINGNAKLNIEGVLYLPNGNVQVNGDSGTESKLCFQISAWTLDIRGNAYLKTLCEVDDTTEAGSAPPTVRLVA